MEEVSVDDEEEVCETRTAAHFYGDYGPDDDAAAHFYGDNAAVLTDPARFSRVRAHRLIRESECAPEETFL